MFPPSSRDQCASRDVARARSRTAESSRLSQPFYGHSPAGVSAGLRVPSRRSVATVVERKRQRSPEYRFNVVDVVPGRKKRSGTRNLIGLNGGGVARDRPRTGNPGLTAIGREHVPLRK